MWKRLGLDHMPWIIVLAQSSWRKLLTSCGFRVFLPCTWTFEELYLFHIIQQGAVFPSVSLGFFRSNLIYKHQRIQNVLPAISAFQFETEFTFLPCGGHRSRKAKKKKARKIRKPTNFSFLFAKINKCCHTHKFSFDSWHSVTAFQGLPVTDMNFDFNSVQLTDFSDSYPDSQAQTLPVSLNFNCVCLIQWEPALPNGT